MVVSINLNVVDHFIYFLLTLLELLLGRSLQINLRSRIQNLMAMNDKIEATDLGGTADVGDVRTTYWVPEDNTMHHLDNEIRTETSTTEVLLFDIDLTQSIVIVFSQKWAY